MQLNSVCASQRTHKSFYKITNGKHWLYIELWGVVGYRTFPTSALWPIKSRITNTFGYVSISHWSNKKIPLPTWSKIIKPYLSNFKAHDFSITTHQFTPGSSWQPPPSSLLTLCNWGVGHRPVPGVSSQVTLADSFWTKQRDTFSGNSKHGLDVLT